MTKKWVYVPEHGGAFIVSIGDNDDTLKALQTLVDGLIDCVSATALPEGQVLDVYVNDEGLLNEFSLNPTASLLCERPIVGPVVFTRSNDDGDTVGLTDADIEMLDERILFLSGEVIPDYRTVRETTDEIYEALCNLLRVIVLENDPTAI